MKHFSILLLTSIFFLLNGCNSPSLSNGKVKKEYFTGGKVRTEFTMSDKSGQNGVLKKYGYDGHITSIAHIKNGVTDGIEVWYDKSGRILMKVPYTNGRKNGLQKAFYPNGDLMISTTYINGVKSGRAIAYNKDGSIHRKVIFRKGHIVN
jgi:antitoxin component YwqK of YwqJK toxin-antitoxin module